MVMTLFHCAGFITVTLLAATSANPTPESATITSGVIWKDASGNPVHAHGAGLILPASHPSGSDGKYYMVGATKKTQPGWLSSGINMYSSYDLETWKFEHIIFHNSSITVPLPKGEIPFYRIERPKVIYNAETKKYVMWFHLDSNGFKLEMVGVATCDTIAGDYTFIHGFQPDGRKSYDMGLFQETDGSGDAYLVRSVENQFAGISKLTPDYLNTTGIISSAYATGTKGGIEGQALWREGDTYYLIGSHLTGWSANDAVFASAPAPLKGAKWTILGNPGGSKNTFNSQSTYVLPYVHPVTKKVMRMFLGDRWNDHGPGSVGNASYVWLPLIRDAKDPSGWSIVGPNGGDDTWKIADFSDPSSTSSYFESYDESVFMRAAPGALEREWALQGAPTLPFQPFSPAYVAKALAANPMDWRTKNAVTPVKNQGPHGYCGTFGRVASAEGQFALKTGKLVSFSEEMLVDCIGWDEDQYSYFTEKGFMTTKSYPYNLTNYPDHDPPIPGNPCRYDAKKVVAGSNHARFNATTGNAPNETQLLAFIHHNGPVSTGINANVFGMRAKGCEASGDCFITAEMCNDPKIKGKPIDHSVTTVGYGSDKENGDYWLIKNSWSENFANAGFIKVARGINCAGLCSSAGICGHLFTIGDPSAYWEE